MRRFIFASSLLLAYLSCGTGTDEYAPIAEAPYFPPISGTGSWETKTIGSLGWNQDATGPLLAYLEAKHT
ncbi:MAG TPA: serine hydrolase, partial [Flavobacterium sp.]|nr:serine hydrolase [Flavobacterium sp.]